MEITKVKHKGENYCIDCDKKIPYWNRHCSICYVKRCKKSLIQEKCNKIGLLSKKLDKEDAS